MTAARTVVLTALAMLAFAANSVLCRIALTETRIDPATFTAIRLLAGALVLWLVACLRGGWRMRAGSWLSAIALFGYAAAFSFAYVSLSAATGALLLFGAVQLTMTSHGIRKGERLHVRQFGGLVLALAGLVGLLLPGLSAPPVHGASLMLAAGVAWGVYSLRGRGADDPVAVTAGNFVRAVPFAVILGLGMLGRQAPDRAGIAYAIVSGALASGVGYVIWYAALPRLSATTAATVQLSVPLIAAYGGIVFLAEPVTLRLVFAALAILGGIAMVVVKRGRGGGG